MGLIEVHQWFFIFGGVLSLFEFFFRNRQFIKIGSAILITGMVSYLYPEIEPYQLVVTLALAMFVVLYLIADEKIDNDNMLINTKKLDDTAQIPPHSYKYKYKYNNNFH